MTRARTSRAGRSPCSTRSGLVRVQSQPALDQPLADRVAHLAGLRLADTVHDGESGPGELHSRPLAEPAVRVSAQRAPITQ
jgi:hypothetical protein